MIRALVIGVVVMFAMVMTGATGAHAKSAQSDIAALQAAVATLQATVTALQTALDTEIAARQAAAAALQAGINNEAAARAAADASETAARQAADAALQASTGLHFTDSVGLGRVHLATRIFVKQFDFSVDATPHVQTFIAECGSNSLVVAGTAQNLAYPFNFFSSHDYTFPDGSFSATLVVSVVDEVKLIITCLEGAPLP